MVSHRDRQVTSGAEVTAKSQLDHRAFEMEREGGDACGSVRSTTARRARSAGNAKPKISTAHVRRKNDIVLHVNSDAGKLYL